MIEVQVRDANKATVYASNNARWSFSGSWLSVNGPDGNGRGPFFTIYLPLSLRRVPRREQIITYIGKGELGLASMWGGASARDGAGSYDITSITAVSEAVPQVHRIVLDVELGQPHLNTFQGGSPSIKAGAMFTIEVLAPFDDLFAFLDISKTAEAWDNLAKHVKENYDFNLAPSESLRNA